MLESGWLFVGVVATILTIASVIAMSAYRPETTGDTVTIVVGIGGFIAWLIWSFGTLEVVAVADSTTHTFTMPALTLFGVMMSIIPGFAALTGPVDLINQYRDPETRDI